MSGSNRGPHLDLGLPSSSQVFFPDWAGRSSAVTRNNKTALKLTATAPSKNGGKMGEPGLLRPQATPRFAAPGNQLRKGAILTV